MQCSAVQCSAVQYSTVQYSTVQYSAVQCSAVQCSAVLYNIKYTLCISIQHIKVKPPCYTWLPWVMIWRENMTLPLWLLFKPNCPIHPPTPQTLPSHQIVLLTHLSLFRGMKKSLPGISIAVIESDIHLTLWKLWLTDLIPLELRLGHMI
jgi:hypothetical protein